MIHDDAKKQGGWPSESPIKGERSDRINENFNNAPERRNQRGDIHNEVKPPPPSPKKQKDNSPKE